MAVRRLESERLFAEDYAINLDAAHAAAAAGVSEYTGRHFLKKPHVKVMIRKLMQERQERIAMDADRLAQLYVMWATVDPGALFEMGPDGKSGMIDVSRWPLSLRMSVQSIDMDEHGRVLKVRFTSRVRAGDMLARVLGIYQSRRKLAAGASDYLDADTAAKLAELSLEDIMELSGRPRDFARIGPPAAEPEGDE